MERGDVHAARLAEEDRREERHERLVEVEQVEALLLEHPPALGHEARRERDRAHRPVGRHAEALAEPDDVALGRGLEAVTGGDDPDVVAAQPEVPVEVVDVLGGAARERVYVRGDESDLHGAVSRATAAPSGVSCVRSSTPTPTVSAGPP